jgi:hypothetical protein
LKHWADLDLDVTVVDPHILRDIDTPEDLSTLTGKIRSTPE